MKDFFMYETELPAGSGFEMFGIIHIVWLILIIISVLLVSFLYCKAPYEKYKQGVNLLFGIIMPFISIYRDMILIVTGHYSRFFLPLHLCGMALWIGSLYCYTKWRFVGVVYVLLCVPGALSALIFPDWIAYPLWNYMHIHDFISHGMIVAWGICLIASGEICPDWKEIWMPIVFGLVGIGIIYPINMILETNYWFLSGPSPGSPLVVILDYMGEKWYLTGYILFVLLIIVLWMALIKLFYRLKNIRKK